MNALPLPIEVLFAGTSLLVLIGVLVAIVDHRQRKAPLRVCVECGCTDDRACPGGCFWVTTFPPVCSRCFV